MIIDGIEYLTITEASKLTGRTRQAIHQKIQSEWQDKCIQHKVGVYQVWLIPKDIIDSYEPQNYPEKLN